MFQPTQIEAAEPSVEDRIAATRAALAAQSAIPLTQQIRDLNIEADELWRSLPRRWSNR